MESIHTKPWGVRAKANVDLCWVYHLDKLVWLSTGTFQEYIFLWEDIGAYALEENDKTVEIDGETWYTMTVKNQVFHFKDEIVRDGYSTLCRK